VLVVEKNEILKRKKLNFKKSYARELKK